METTIRKWGHSLALRIPKSFAAELGIEDGATVELTVANGRLVLTPVTGRRYTLRQLLRHVTRRNTHAAVETGPAVGREVW